MPVAHLMVAGGPSTGPASQGLLVATSLVSLIRTPFSKIFVFGTGGRIRQSPRKIDFSTFNLKKGF